jgi:hypothetical protein
LVDDTGPGCSLPARRRGSSIRSWERPHDSCCNYLTYLPTQSRPRSSTTQLPYTKSQPAVKMCVPCTIVPMHALTVVQGGPFGNHGQGLYHHRGVQSCHAWRNHPQDVRRQDEAAQQAHSDGLLRRGG